MLEAGPTAADTASLRVCVSGGAALPVEVLRGFDDQFGARSSRATACRRPRRSRRSTSSDTAKPGSIGTAGRGRRDARASTAPAARSPRASRRDRDPWPQRHEGLLERPDATDEAIKGGWFRTGDIGRVDEDGYFYIVDRKKDLIIRGGYNVYPREIEEVLYEHPAVAGGGGDRRGRTRPRRGGRRRRRAQAGRAGHTPTSCATSSRSGSRPTSTRAWCGWSTRCPRDRRARSSNARSSLRSCRDGPRHDVPAGRRPLRAGRPAGPTADPGRARARPGGCFPAARLRLRRRTGPPAATAAAERAMRSPATWPASPAARRRSHRPSATSDSPMRPGRRTRPLRRLVQAYLATAQTVEGSIGEVPTGLADSERVKFAAANLIEALAPSNNPLVSPVGLEGGHRQRRREPDQRAPAVGARTCPRRRASRRWSTRTPTRVGRDLAVTPARWCSASPVLELIQYRPQTETVKTVPLLIIPPTINKYYALDLAPGRSLIEYLRATGPAGVRASRGATPTPATARGASTSTPRRSWRHSTPSTRSPALAWPTWSATCSGGLLAAITAAYRAASGGLDRLASLSLLVTMIDQTRAGVLSAHGGRAGGRGRGGQVAAQGIPRRATAWPRCSRGCAPTT